MMIINEVLFYFFAAVAVLSAGVVLFSNNLLYAAFSLILTFLCVAALYIFAGAEFVAITQIMIYVGGIMVLMIFGIMLTNKISGKAMSTQMHNKGLALLICSTLFGLLLYGIVRMNFFAFENVISPVGENICHLGIGLMTDYVLPFEIVGVLLLIALVGALTVAGYKQKK